MEGRERREGREKREGRERREKREGRERRKRRKKREGSKRRTSQGRETWERGTQILRITLNRSMHSKGIYCTIAATYSTLFPQQSLQNG